MIGTVRLRTPPSRRAGPNASYRWVTVFKSTQIQLCLHAIEFTLARARYGGLSKFLSADDYQIHPRNETLQRSH